MNFWQQLTTPFLGLSPMDGITDFPFRLLLSNLGKPDVLYTEFVSVDAIIHSPKVALANFNYSEIERPIVAQLFGNNPDHFYIVAHIIAEIGFDGIDINMGCPAKNVAGSGSGAGLIKTPILAKSIIKSVREGLLDWQKNGLHALPNDLKSAIKEFKKRNKIDLSKNVNKKLIPYSVKTRIGYSENQISDWLPILLEEKPSHIAVHGRTLKQGYSGRADWNAIKKGSLIVKDFNQNRTNKIIYSGNGDITSREQAYLFAKKYQVSGILVGRSVLGNPWFFSNHIPNTTDKLNIMIKHAELIEKHKQKKEFVQIRKHLGWYAKGFYGASELRKSLMQVKNKKDVEKIINSFKPLT